MSVTIPLAAALAVIVATLVTWTATYVLLRRRMDGLRQEAARLQGEIDARLRLVEEKEAIQRQLRTPRAASEVPVNAPPRRRSTLARPRQQDVPASGPMPHPQPERGAAGSSLRQARQRSQQRLTRRGHERQASLDAIASELRGLAESQGRLQGAAQAHPEEATGNRAGHRGELDLARVVELTGMAAYCDFRVASSANATAQGPDVVVHAPGDQTVAVGAGVPLASYDIALHSDGDRARREALAAFAGDVRDRATGLAKGVAGDPSVATAQVVALYLPGEQFLSAALEADPALPSMGAQEGIVLASPSHLVALLQTLRMGWHQHAVAANAEQARRKADAVYAHLHELRQRLAGVGSCETPRQASAWHW